MKAFGKLTLGAGRAETVRFNLTSKDLVIWDVTTHQPSTVDGSYRVYVGSSSRDIRAQAQLRVPFTFGAQSIELTAPALTTAGAKITVDGAKPGAARLTANARWSGGARQSATATTTVKIAYPSLTAAFNGTGLSDDANPAGANFDGSGYSFSAQALASVGVRPGASVSYNGLSYNWPSGSPDMVTAAGQAIALSGTGQTLGFLGSANNGTASGPVTVTYADGTTTTGTVTFADWYANAAVPGCTLAVTTPHWNEPPNGLGPHAVSLYTSTLSLSPGKTVAAVTLPDESRLHIFAVTVGQ